MHPSSTETSPNPLETLPQVELSQQGVELQPVRSGGIELARALRPGLTEVHDETVGVFGVLKGQFANTREPELFAKRLIKHSAIQDSNVDSIEAAQSAFATTMNKVLDELHEGKVAKLTDGVMGRVFKIGDQTEFVFAASGNFRMFKCGPRGENSTREYSEINLAVNSEDRNDSLASDWELKPEAVRHISIGEDEKIIIVSGNTLKSPDQNSELADANVHVALMTDDSEVAVKRLLDQAEEKLMRTEDQGAMIIKNTALQPQVVQEQKSSVLHEVPISYEMTPIETKKQNRVISALRRIFGREKNVSSGNKRKAAIITAGGAAAVGSIVAGVNTLEVGQANNHVVFEQVADNAVSNQSLPSSEQIAAGQSVTIDVKMSEGAQPEPISVTIQSDSESQVNTMTQGTPDSEAIPSVQSEDMQSGAEGTSNDRTFIAQVEPGGGIIDAFKSLGLDEESARKKYEAAVSNGFFNRLDGVYLDRDTGEWRVAQAGELDLSSLKDLIERSEQ